MSYNSKYKGNEVEELLDNGKEIYRIKDFNPYDRDEAVMSVEEFDHIVNSKFSYRHEENEFLWLVWDSDIHIQDEEWVEADIRLATSGGVDWHALLFRFRRYSDRVETVSVEEYESSFEDINYCYELVDILQKDGDGSKFLADDGVYKDLSEYAKKTDVPTALSDLDNDTGFITVDTTVNKANVANYLHSTTYTLGGKSVPIYLSNGAVSSCNSYAGGTAVTLNGSSKAASTASFYAPTSYGTSGYLLKANGSGSAPTWISDTSIKSSTSAVKDVQLVTALPSSPVSTTLYLIAE